MYYEFIYQSLGRTYFPNFVFFSSTQNLSIYMYMYIVRFVQYFLGYDVHVPICVWIFILFNYLFLYTFSACIVQHIDVTSRKIQTSETIRCKHNCIILRICIVYFTNCFAISLLLFKIPNNNLVRSLYMLIWICFISICIVYYTGNLKKQIIIWWDHLIC